MRLLLALISLLLCGCAPDDAPAPGSLALVRLQTDWYPQAEHGGFYYAQVHGYYAEEGLEVDILPGGLNFMGALKVTEGQAEFAINKADAILRHQAQGMPLEIVLATLQHDPQGILMHATNPVDSFEDLDGKTLMAMPGATWLEYLRRRYHIEPRIVPHDKSMERFLADPSFMQQCMATSEPYFARLRGVEPKVLLLRDSGFDPYHVLYTNSNYAREHPGTVAAFARATRRGWIDYLTQDPTSTHARIKELNPRQTDALLNYSRNALIEGQFAFGSGGPTQFGQVDPDRMATLEAQMRALDLL